MIYFLIVTLDRDMSGWLFFLSFSICGNVFTPLQMILVDVDVVLQTLTLFQTKVLNFPAGFQAGVTSKIHTQFQTFKLK